MKVLNNNNNNSDTYVVQICRCSQFANAYQCQTEMFSVFTDINHFEKIFVSRTLLKFCSNSKFQS